jgi:hypothetical protein
MTRITKRFVQLVNKLGTPVGVSKNNELLISSSSLNSLEESLALASNSEVTTIPSAATNTTLAPANENRRSLKITNDADTDLLIKEGLTASATSFTWRVLTGETVIIDDYNGIVEGIWEGVPTGNGMVTETTF